MNDETPDNPENDADLPAIEFDSPGRFVIHNPGPAQTEGEIWEPAPCQLGVTSELQPFGDLRELRMHVVAQLQQARRSVCIYTPDLEPWLFDHSTIQQALTQLLLASPRNQLRVLVQDSGRAVRQGHRLLHLAKRLTSNMHLRKLNPEMAAPDAAYLIVDEVGLVLRNLNERYAGVAHYNAPSRARQQLEVFDRHWDSGLADPDLRSFLL